MERIFKVETTGRNVKCPCGNIMPKDSKQLKILSSTGRYGVSYAFLCPSCADKELSIISEKLEELKKLI